MGVPGPEHRQTSPPEARARSRRGSLDDWYKNPGLLDSNAEGASKGQAGIAPLKLPHMSPDVEVYSIHTGRPGGHLPPGSPMLSTGKDGQMTPLEVSPIPHASLGSPGE